MVIAAGGQVVAFAGNTKSLYHALLYCFNWKWRKRPTRVAKCIGQN